MQIKDKNLYYIGGAVRDEILGVKSLDVDLTYDGDAINFVKNLKNIDIIQINKDFGTVRIKSGDQLIDIASTRSETYPQKGHLPVINKIGCTLKEDVLRRDFTVNALAKSTLTGEIIDYTGGLKDLKEKKLKVLYNESFIDDPTRIVRALKFSVRFGFELDENSEKLQEQYLNNINYDMSYKRLKKELLETFNLNSWKAFEIFVNKGIYKLVANKEFTLPEYDFSGLIKKYKPENVWIIYAGLLPDVSALPLTKIEAKIVNEYTKLCNNRNLNNDFEIYKTLNEIPLESAIMYSSKNPEIIKHYLEDLKDIKLKITGNHLKNLGINPSSQYQKCFDFVLRKKIENPQITLEDEIELAREFFI